MSFSIERSRAITPLFTQAPHPPNMVARQYQHAGVEFAASRNHCLIGDAPGVGKTAQAILLSNLIGAKKTLVVCPASLRLNWQKEIWMWSTIPNVHVHPILKASNGVNQASHYVVISYDLLRNQAIQDALFDARWDHLVLDEAHALKDPNGNKRTRVICAPDMLPAVVGRITMLSGTIMPNQPIECYNAARLLGWDCIDRMNLEDFREYYYAKGGGMVRGPVWDDKLQANIRKLHFSDQVRNIPRREDELQARLRGNIMVRRLKEQVLKELPAKQYKFVPLEIDRGIQEALNHPGWSAASALYEAEQEEFDGDIPIIGEISTARRLLGEAKAMACIRYIHDLMQEVNKLVVSAHHSSVLAIARKELVRYGLAYMDGSTPSKKREEAVVSFQTNPRCRIILGQTQVIGEGHTLTAAQDVLAMEPDWVPGRTEQLGDRVHRLGQAGDYVIVHIPVVPGTLDERVISRAIEKSKAIYNALDAQ